MADVLRFDNSDEYERFMGRWTRAVARVFLEWLAVPPGADWLDVGCGTGILAETVLHQGQPARVDAVDVEPAQVAAAARGPAGGAVRFVVGDATQLPCADAKFDVVASALVINFVADRARALAEMRRVSRAGGLIAAYVWDFGGERSPSGPLRNAMQRLGTPAPAVPGTEASSPAALHSLFGAAGLERIETRSIDVCLSYANFDDFWQAQTPAYAPHTKIIAALSEGARSSLRDSIARSLPCGPNGTIDCFARAHAVKARVPSV